MLAEVCKISFDTVRTYIRKDACSLSAEAVAKLKKKGSVMLIVSCRNPTKPTEATKYFS